MIDNSWILGVESMVFTIIKSKCMEKLQEIFPSIEFTTSDKAKMTRFPTIYIHMLPTNAKTDIENNINGIINCTFQVEIFSDVSQNDCRKAMYDVLDAFSSIGFGASIRGYMNTNVYKYVATFHRTLGANDTL